MTIDEEIKHQEEISDRYARMSEYEENNGNDGIAKDCAQCAADHRQLAEWLTELKELRGLVAASNVLAKDVLAVDTLCKQILEYKRLLKLAVEDFPDLTDMWRYADEALKLIGEETDEKP
jgi:hypothetical protein